MTRLLNTPYRTQRPQVSHHPLRRQARQEDQIELSRNVPKAILIFSRYLRSTHHPRANSRDAIVYIFRRAWPPVLYAILPTSNRTDGNRRIRAPKSPRCGSKRSKIRRALPRRIQRSGLMYIFPLARESVRPHLLPWPANAERGPERRKRKNRILHDGGQSVQSWEM